MIIKSNEIGEESSLLRIFSSSLSLSFLCLSFSFFLSLPLSLHLWKTNFSPSVTLYQMQMESCYKKFIPPPHPKKNQAERERKKKKGKKKGKRREGKRREGKRKEGERREERKKEGKRAHNFTASFHII